MTVRPYKYWRRVINDQPYGLLPASQYNLTGPTANRAHDDLLVRTRVHVRATFAVGVPTSDVPPERWWTNLSINYAFSWDPAGASPHLRPDSSDHRLKLTGSLRPTLVASPSAPTSYYVVWEGYGEDIDSKGAIVGNGTNFGKGELVLFLFDHDLGWTSGIYTSIGMAIFSYIECLFESSAASP